MFVSFHGANELRLGNVAYHDTMEEIKENVIPMWPHGISAATIPVPHAFHILFNRNPWTSSGTEALLYVHNSHALRHMFKSHPHSAQKMICETFTCLSRIGYQYRTSLSTGYPVCLPFTLRLVHALLTSMCSILSWYFKILVPMNIATSLSHISPAQDTR